MQQCLRNKPIHQPLDLLVWGPLSPSSAKYGIALRTLSRSFQSLAHTRARINVLRLATLCVLDHVWVSFQGLSGMLVGADPASTALAGRKQRAMHSTHRTTDSAALRG